MLRLDFFFFFFNDPATPEIYPLSLHDALPISRRGHLSVRVTARCRHSPHDLIFRRGFNSRDAAPPQALGHDLPSRPQSAWRSEEHTSELQSPCNLVCRLLLEKKKTTKYRLPMC